MLAGEGGVDAVLGGGGGADGDRGVVGALAEGGERCADIRAEVGRPGRLAEAGEGARRRIGRICARFSRAKRQAGIEAVLLEERTEGFGCEDEAIGDG